MKYSGSDFKFTSQANHMQKLLQLKKDYEREGFHLQRLYKRRTPNKDGIMRSTFDSIMNGNTIDYAIDGNFLYIQNIAVIENKSEISESIMPEIYTMKFDISSSITREKDEISDSIIKINNFDLASIWK